MCVTGQVHLTTAREICEIGSLFYCQEMLSEAQLNFKRCFDIRKELLGIVHPDTQTALTYYADVLYDQGTILIWLCNGGNGILDVWLM